MIAATAVSFFFVFFAVADDLTIITRSKDLMNKVWASLKEGFDWCGLLANAKKCRYLTFHKGELLEEEEVELGDGTMVPGGTKHGASFPVPPCA